MLSIRLVLQYAQYQRYNYTPQLMIQMNIYYCYPAENKSDFVLFEYSQIDVMHLYLYYKDSCECVCPIRPPASVSGPILNPSTFTDSPCVRGVWKNPKPGIGPQTKKFLA